MAEDDWYYVAGVRYCRRCMTQRCKRAGGSLECVPATTGLAEFRKMTNVMDDQAERIRLLEIQVRSHNLAIRRSELTLRRIAQTCLAARESKDFEAAVAEIAAAHHDWVSGKMLVDTPVTDAVGKTVIYSHCDKHGPYVRTDENVCPACWREEGAAG